MDTLVLDIKYGHISVRHSIWTYKTVDFRHGYIRHFIYKKEDHSIY